MNTEAQKPSGMDLPAIEAAIASGDTTLRMRAITAMQPYEPQACVPLLLKCLDDDAFVVRSLACMGLGYKRNPDGLQALLVVMQDESDHNVRAEAANAVARHGGDEALRALLDLYARDDHWLVRTSILAAMAAEDEMPMEPLQQLAEQGCADGNETVRGAGQGLQLRLQQRRLERLI